MKIQDPSERVLRDVNVVTLKMSSKKETTQVLPIWGLSVPLPAVLMITLSLYMLVLGVGLWIRSCLKGRCSSECSTCCPNISIFEECHRFAEMCDCRLPTLRSCRGVSCPSLSCPSLSCPSLSCPSLSCPPSCSVCDCACGCQPVDSCNCLCFEIRIK